MEKQGLVIVHTGNGKGKTTAALGMGLRAWGNGFRVLVLQFIKGGWKYGELQAIGRLGPDFIIRQMGEGFVKGSNDDAMAPHKAAAKEALAAARQEMTSGNWDYIVLDEINYAVHFGLISVDDVLNLLSVKPPQLHLVLTGRNAAAAVIEKADLVTEMKEVKHPFQQGVKAQQGIEY
ncbi:cob(I)yrinic acid a,c-diamide adenosyltransferase [Anaerosporomusa subterranea]|uniref:Cob(I)yrinic acid a,c-diamide adenosyltransferase n=1 Tax=Anaerosporomusa subterranea TaxID=1794912 RepID=A0A154BRP2_ANASB|nr:cob(I)yrinic acid a,c-diamide adenosyltransferase [Anaerosporomusa subterranea]KYZ76616.1 cob(I)yrinic acid a,c-diamide adenosyltransferase [Anaerosporomusa subterranea]